MAAQVPLNVSPLIKGVRWTLFISGVVYGMTRYNYLKKREDLRLAELERTRPEREARERLELELKNKAEVEELEAIARGSPKP